MNAPFTTALTARLGCRYPVIQTAMGWVAEPPLVAAVGEAGGFGFLAAAVMTPDTAREKIRQLRKLTSKPFGVNFHMFQPGAAEIVALVIEHREQIRAVSFGRGPDKKMIARFKDAGILCIPTVGALKHAQKVVELGVDMVTVQGGEGGGHTGSVPSTVLLPQVLDTVKVPVIACGGFCDGRGLAAALAYGAAGVAMGTRFLLTKESPVPDATKQRYLKASPGDMVVTTKLDGLPQRMLKTPLIAQIERAGVISRWYRALQAGLLLKRETRASWGELWRAAQGMRGHGGLSFSQAMMAAAAPMLLQTAMVKGEPDHGVMSSGVVGGRIDDLPSCQELIARMIDDAARRLQALTSISKEMPDAN